MDADTFYEEFKAVLAYLEISWGRKNEAEVYIKDNRFVIVANGKEVSFAMKEK